MTATIKLYILLLVFLSIFSCNEREPVKKNSSTVEMHFEDVDNFWSAYDKIKDVKSHAERTKVIQREYIDKSSKGLKLLIEKDKLTAEDYATFLKDTVFFNSIKQVTLDAKKDTLRIRKNLQSFEKIYPEATFDDIYFVMGQFKRAGTVIDSTMIIELEKNAKSPTTASAFLFDEEQLHNLNDYESLIPLVVHEQVHINQININTRSLLSKSICEGSADFLMHLQTGKFPSATRGSYSYGDANEAALWVKFQTDLDINYKYIKTDWFYNYDRKDIPPDLGYYIGFKICEKFYNEAKDKVQAIKFMLNISNSEKLLELSNYNGGL